MNIVLLKARPGLLCITCCLLLPFYVCGQLPPKKDLKEADYSLWGNTETDKLSPDGNWASYITFYERGTDTLFVRNTTSKKTYAFPSGSNSTFTSNGFFYCQRGNDLMYINPGAGKQQIISGAGKYKYSQRHNLIVYLVKDSGNNKELRIQSGEGKILKTIENAVQFSLSPDGDHLLCSVFRDGKYTLLLTDLKKMTLDNWITAANTNQFTHFVWSKDGGAAACFSADDKNNIKSLFLYRLDLKQLFEFDPAVQKGFPENTSMISFMGEVLISDDLQRVFFHIRKNTGTRVLNPAVGPEIWNVNDKVVYSRNGGKQVEFPKVMMWRPMAGGFSQLTSEGLPNIMLLGDQQHAVLSNPLEYEPQFNDEGPRDYYLLDLNTMEKRKILTKISPSAHEVVPSPDGRYITYFKDNNWWTYDILRDLHTDVTSGLSISFAGKSQVLDPISPYGHPGWSADNKELLLYDQYDIWAVNPDGSASRRLTQGREKGITYRIGDIPNNNKVYFIYDGLKPHNYDLNKEMVLNASGADGKTGYFLWKNNRIERTIAYGDYYIDQLYYTADKGKLIYRRQKFDVSPQLVFKEGKGKENIFLQSNPQQENYHWGKSELVRFENSKQQQLKGVLYYPANYDPQKKYPMVVHVYEIQSADLHYYQMPSMQNVAGFNSAVLTSKGYFVFLPDIILEKEHTGPSALDCVTAGVEKVISMGIVDPHGIGLMGHSYGGYETAFIVNHTRLFRTAIASGAITDLTSLFLNINWRTGKPDMWRFYNQFRMHGKNPSEHPEVFSRNSPLSSVANLQIPLLLWSGREDTQVDWHQSVEYYLAMRRLGKKGIMLLYPEEGHILMNAANQEDITRRVLQWFGHYLKDEKPDDWIANGVGDQ